MALIFVSKQTKREFYDIYIAFKKQDQGATQDDVVKALIELYKANLEAAEKLEKQAKKKGEAVA